MLFACLFPTDIKTRKIFFFPLNERNHGAFAHPHLHPDCTSNDSIPNEKPWLTGQSMRFLGTTGAPHSGCISCSSPCPSLQQQFLVIEQITNLISFTSVFISSPSYTCKILDAQEQLAALPQHVLLCAFLLWGVP